MNNPIKDGVLLLTIGMLFAIEALAAEKLRKLLGMHPRRTNFARGNLGREATQLIDPAKLRRPNARTVHGNDRAFGRARREAQGTTNGGSVSV